jgi:hypothetical protein
MNRMRTIGSRKISDTSDSDAYAPQRTAVVGGTSTLGRKMSNSVRASDIKGFDKVVQVLEHAAHPASLAKRR